MESLAFFFFSSRRRHTRSTRDWSSDVCSSDLEHGARIVPVEADASGFLLQLERAGERRQAGRNARERVGLMPAGAFAALGARVLLLGLDALPQLVDGGHGQGAGIAEHVRMAAQELRRDGMDDVAEIERTRLLGHARVEGNLEQQIPELVAQILEIAARD